LSTHHDGCFGCGQANLFGLQLENGRFFVKQDHQGERGFAHPGVIAAALYEVTGGQRLEVEFVEPVPVGVFVQVEATRDGAKASVDGRLVAWSARVRAAT
jgi:hypothetical protein